MSIAIARGTIMDHTVTTMPTERRPGCPFDPPAELLEARERLSNLLSKMDGNDSLEQLLQDVVKSTRESNNKKTRIFSINW